MIPAELLGFLQQLEAGLPTGTQKVGLEQVLVFPLMKWNSVSSCAEILQTSAMPMEKNVLPLSVDVHYLTAR